MKAFFQYVGYIFRHKYYVFIECCKLGIWWRGITHDMSKFSPQEFFPYMQKFYGKKKGTGFKRAWQSHVNHNSHHWQFHVAIDGVDINGKPIFTPLEMPEVDAKECVADWLGMHKTIKSRHPLEWYNKNKDKILLHPSTRKLVEELLAKVQE